MIIAIIHIALALALAPLLQGIVNRTKAVFAGRKGKPLMQLYYDLAKLLRKGAVYSSTTTWVFRAGPVVGLSAVLASLLLLPSGSAALISFPGDFVLFAYLLGVARFFTVIAALDTGSSFEGMGASREVTFSVLAEPALFLVLLALAQQGDSISLSGIFSSVSAGTWRHEGPSLALAAAALFMLALAENSRIPVDDPNTHLELTMIHEVMVLDHSGPDFAFILYGAAVKFWIFGVLVVNVIFPVLNIGLLSGGIVFLLGMALFGIFVGMVESSMARLRLLRVPQFLVASAALAICAIILGM